MHVPLVIRAPDVEPSTTDAMCEMVDLYPTLLELLGIPSRHFHFGRSLVPLMRGEAAQHRDAVFASAGALAGEDHFNINSLSPDNWYVHRMAYGKRDAEATWSRAAMIRTRTMRYTFATHDVDELVDLADDPAGIHNLAEEPDCQESRNDLRDRLLTWMLETSDTLPFQQGSRHWHA